MDRGLGLFGIAGAVVEDIAVGGIIPEQAGAGECPEKQHVALKRIGQCDHRSGCPHVADHPKNFIVLIKLLHRLSSSSRLVAVVCRDEPELPPMHTAIGIGGVERSHDAHLHILAELFGWTAECCGHPKPNFGVSHTAKKSFGATRFLLERLRCRCNLRLRVCGRGRRGRRCWCGRGLCWLHRRSGRWLRASDGRWLWNKSRRGSRDRGRGRRRVWSEAIAPPIQRCSVRDWLVGRFRGLSKFE